MWFFNEATCTIPYLPVSGWLLDLDAYLYGYCSNNAGLQVGSASIFVGVMELVFGFNCAKKTETDNEIVSDQSQASSKQKTGFPTLSSKKVIDVGILQISMHYS